MGCGASSLKGDFNAEGLGSAPTPVMRQPSTQHESSSSNETHPESEQKAMKTLKEMHPPFKKSIKTKTPDTARQAATSTATETRYLDKNASSRQELADYYNPKKKDKGKSPYRPSDGSKYAFTLGMGASVA